MSARESSMAAIDSINGRFILGQFHLDTELLQLVFIITCGCRFEQVCVFGEWDYGKGQISQ